MRIRSIHVKHFRSVESASMTGCGGLNVLIGKNNAGKSNLLSTIELMHSHLSRGYIAGPWYVTRPENEFNDRDTSQSIQIGVEFDLDEEINKQLREQLLVEAPHLEQSISQVSQFDSVSFILSGTIRSGRAFLFLQTAIVGKLVFEDNELKCQGIPLIGVSAEVGEELFLTHQEISTLRESLKYLETLDPERISPMLVDRSRVQPQYYIDSYLPRLPFGLRPELLTLIAASKTMQEIESGINQIQSDLKSQIDQLGRKETEGSISAFAGKTKLPPGYARWLMTQYGSALALHFGETKQPIGRDEAMALLDLKIKRGGSERFAAIQNIVRSLLGVNIDAFESENLGNRARLAEMDVDEFLAEANGRGVREALRLILDIELKEPKLVLIEEPEVHLHPGLEHAVYSYLRDKSRTVQIFVTTHSTNFVDSISFQNIYLISRDTNKNTRCEAVDSGDGIMRIPSELGLRLSTVFMFDRLIFVEGPSDEAVLREIAQGLQIDLAKANIEFVQMGGVRNFAHFAAEGTLDLLSKRRIKMRFVTDRDERDDQEVKRMLDRLGERAELTVLGFREMENYLLDPRAFQAFVMEKRKAAGVKEGETPSIETITTALRDEAIALRDEVVRLRVEKRVLRSVHLQTRGSEGTPKERIDAAVKELTDRLAQIEDVRRQIEKEVETQWPEQAQALAPGTRILENTAKRFGITFNKEAGDSARLARCLSKESYHWDLREMLRQISAATD